MASGKHLNIDLSFRSDTSAVQKDIQKLQGQLDNLLKTTSKSTGQFSLNKELHEASKAAIELKQHLEKAVNVNTGSLDVGMLSKSFKQAGTSLEEYRQKLSKLGPEGEKVFSSFAKTIINAEVPLRKTNALLDQFATTLKNTARWQISSSILHGFMGSLQSAFYYAQDLNKSLNNIRIVTGYSKDQMAQFAEEANKAAQALNTTTTEYTNASLIYYQQGLDDEAVKKRTDTTIKMANVARESAEEVSQQMTAIWNNFDDGSKSLEYYADVITALGAATASSSDEIAEGLEKFAAVADTVGLSYEYATAALATVTATTRQSADVVGNAFKTLFARLEGLKLGETLDDGTDLNKYSQALATVGVNIKDTDGELKKMDQILDELGEKWKTLSESEQMAVAQTVGGVRQYTQLIALMKEWEFFQENVGVARDSSGTLQEQADIYAESWEAAKDRVAAAAEEIYHQLLNDDFFIELNNGFAEFLNIISKAIDGIGGLRGVLSGLGILITKMFGESIVATFNSFFSTQTQRLNEWKNAQNDAVLGLMEAAKESGLENAPAAYSRVAEATEYIINESKQLTAEQQEQLKLELKQLQNRAESIEQYEKEIKIAEEELELAQERDKIARQNLNRTTKNKENIISIVPEAQSSEAQKAIVEYTKISQSAKAMNQEIRNATPEFKNLIAAMDGNVNAANAVASAIDQESAAMKKSAATTDEATEKETILIEKNRQLEGSIRDLDDAYEHLGESSKKPREEIRKTIKEAPDLGQNIVNFAQGLMSVSLAISTIKGLGSIWSDEDTNYWEKLLSTITAVSMALPMIITGFKSLYTSITKMPIAVIKFALSLGTVRLEEIITIIQTEGLSAAFKKATGSILMMETALGPLWAVLAGGAAIIGAVVLASYGLYKAYNADADAAKAAAEAAQALAEEYDRVKQAYDELKKSLEDYNAAKDAIDKLTEGTQEWKEAVIELNNQVLELLDKYPKLIDYVESSNGMLSISEQGQNALLESQSQEVRNAYQAKLIGQIQKDTAQNKSDFTNLGRRNLYEQSVENSDLTVYAGVDSQSVEKAINAIIKHGDIILQNSEALAKSADITKVEAETLLLSKDEMVNLASKVEANTKANEIRTEELGKSILEEKGWTNTKFANQLVGLLGKETRNLSDKYSKEYDDKTRWTVRKDYLAAHEEFVKYERGAGNKSAKYYYANGESVEIDDNMARAQLAAAKAEEEATNKTHEYINALEKVKAIAPDATDGVLNVVAGIEDNVDNLTKKEVDILKNLIEIDPSILSSFGTTREEFQQTVDSLEKDLEKASADIRSNLLEKAKSIFENLDGLDEVTIEGQRAIAGVLNRAVVLGSEEVLSTVEDIFKDASDPQKFADALNNIPWDEITVDEFRGRLNDAGISINKTDKELESLIDTMKAAYGPTEDLTKQYAEIAKIITGLKQGDTISAEDYYKLTESAQNYFTMMMDGTFKLTGDAEEFYKLVREQQIGKFRNQISDLKEKNSYNKELRNKDFDFDNLNKNQISNINKYRGTIDYNAEGTRQQLDVIETFNKDNYEMLEKVALWREKLEKGTISTQMFSDIASAVSDCKDQFDRLDETIAETDNNIYTLDLAIAESYTNFQDLKEAFETTDMSAQAFTQAAIDLDNALDIKNLDADELKDYVSYLKDAAKNSEELSDELKDNSNAAKVVAKGIMKMNDAIDTLATNWEDWSSILKQSTSSSEEYKEAMVGMRKAVADLLDINSDFVSSDFISEHLDKIKEASEGSAEAIDELKQKLSEDIILNIIIDNKLESVENSLLSEFHSLQSSIPDLEVGATLDSGDFIAKAQKLIEDCKMTVDQANAMFDSLGFETTFASEPQTVEQRVPRYVTKETLIKTDYDEEGHKYKTYSTSTYQDGFDTFEGTMDVPAIAVNGKTPKIETITKKATGSFNNYSSSNKGGTKTPGGKGTKGAKRDKPDKKDLIDDKPDRYYDINNAISKVNQELERQEQIEKRLSKYQEHYAGKTLIASLKKQNDLLKEKNSILDKQYQNYERLYEIQSQELGELKGKIGGSWNGDELQNYTELFQANVDKYNAAISAYNAMSKEQQEASGKQMIEDAKTAYDTYKDALERYQDLYYKEMYDTENKLAEYRQQQLENQFKIIENNLKGWETEIQLKLDMTGLKREWKAFLKDVETDFRKIYENLSKTSMFDTDSFNTYVEDAETRMQQIADVEAEIRKMDASKDANGAVQISDDMMFGSISEAQEYLKKLQSELVDVGNSLNSMYKQVWDNYIKGLDQAKNNFEDINKELEHLTNMLEYEKELIELIYGDKAFDLMNKYYETQQKNIETRIDSTRQQAEFWEDQFNKAFEMNKDKHNVNKDDMSTWTEDMKKAYEEMIASQEKLNDLVLEGIKNLKDEYINNVAKTLSEMDKAVWGMSLDDLKEDWDFLQKKADEYLDDVEGAYKIQSLANKIDKSISEMSNIKSQQKLAKLREDEMKMLREKERLTQDDIDLAEARYQIALKEIALEDAQNSKTSMKLSRDTSGNWTYQYVADEEDVQTKQQDLLDAYNNLYETADNAYQHSMELAMQMYEEYQEKFRQLSEELSLNTELSEEQKMQKIRELQDQYLPEIEAALANSQLYQQETIMAGAAVFAEVCEQDGDNYSYLTDLQKTLVDEVRDQHLEDYEEIREAILGDYESIRQIAEEVFQETNINSQTATAAMIQQWDKDSNNSVKGAMNDAFKSLIKYTQDFESELNKLEEISGRNIMDAGGIVDDINNIGDAVDEVSWKTEDMVNSAEMYLDELRTYVNEVEGAWESVINRIGEAIDALQEYLNVSEAVSAEEARRASEAAMRQAEEARKTEYNGGSSGDSENNNSSNRGVAGEERNKNETGPNYYIEGYDDKGYHIQINDLTLSQATERNAIYKKQGYSTSIKHYDTGGYTGDWDSQSGRLAVLHQKELVLNASDTENMLSAVNAIRDIAGLNESISETIANSIGRLIVDAINAGGTSTINNTTTTNDTSNNVFNITAEFPNANDVQTIKDAILSLPNIVSQYVH